MKKLFLYIFIPLFFQGCLETTKTKPSYYEYNTKTYIQKPYVMKKTKKIKKSSLKIISGSIKGIIVELFYDGKTDLWVYAVKSINTTNGKLANARFTHDKSIAKKGDTVYVIIDKNKLKDLYFIKKANYKKNTQKAYSFKKAKKKKVYKRTKARKTPWIGVPLSESISLD